MQYSQIIGMLPVMSQEAGFSEQDADVFGGVTSFVVGAGEGAAFVTIPFLGDLF